MEVLPYFYPSPAKFTSDSRNKDLYVKHATTEKQGAASKSRAHLSTSPSTATRASSRGGMRPSERDNESPCGVCDGNRSGVCECGRHDEKYLPCSSLIIRE